MGYVYPNEVRRQFQLPGGTVGKAVRKVSLDIAADAKRIAEVELGNDPRDAPRTGNYARGFRVIVKTHSTGFEYIVENRRKYAASIEEGARPHIIRARRVQHLTFRGRDGRVRNVKLVSHPGNRPYRILQRAAEDTIRKLR